jgi:hypothetical protein
MTGIKSVLTTWPAKLPRRGVIGTVLGEQVVFADFSTGHGCVLLQRATPDSMGGREVILPFEQVALIKLTEAQDANMHQEMGFETPVN